MADDVLLDTHALLWWFDGTLPSRLDDAIQHAEVAFVSAATIWEAEIKGALGKLRLPVDLVATAQAAGLDILDITGRHAVRAARLPPHHRDPFDRMLVAQALEEQLVLVSRDAVFDAYAVARVWA